MAIILQGKINQSNCVDYYKCAFSGYALFWTGVSVGFSNLFCGYQIVNLEYVWEYREVDVQSLMLKTLTLSLRF